MSGRRLSFTLDEFSVEMARAVASRQGLSLSAWLADTVRQEAVRQGAGPSEGDEAEAPASR